MLQEHELLEDITYPKLILAFNDSRFMKAEELVNVAELSSRLLSVAMSNAFLSKLLINNEEIS